jgi:hypothetical protein
MKQWDRIPPGPSFAFNPGEFELNLVATTSTEGEGDIIAITLPSDVTTVTDLARWTLTQRVGVAKLLCHKIIERIPDQGVPELCETMAEIYDHHRKHAKYQQKTLPFPQTVQAQLGKTYERPGFQIAEE